MDESKYSFGIIIRKRINERLRNLGVCSCGQHLIRDLGSREFRCNNCNNSQFIEWFGGEGRFVIPYLQTVNRDNRGFTIKRINLSVIYKDGFLKPIKENIVRRMEYDIVDKTLRVWKNDELEYCYNKDGNNENAVAGVNRRFFTSLNENTFLDSISNETTRGIYEVVKKHSNVGWKRKKNIIRGLIKFMNDYQWMQILANAGVPNVYRFERGYYWHRNGDNPIDDTQTKPHKILKVPRFMMSYIREDLSIDRQVLSQLQGNFKNIDNNKFKEIMSIVKDESTMKELANSIETVMQIHIDYDYTNIKKLILYLFREVRLTQGIQSPRDASTYLRDYIRMSRAMGLEWERYPKSLKKEHDVVQMNYNLIKDEGNKKREFQLAIDKKSYQNLAFKDKKHEFVIVTPSSPDDIIKEGNELSHCVSSYVEDVINDKCKILFLRDVKEIDKPLVTIEVRGMNIRQARGFANRPVGEKEKEFIKLWSNKKELIEAYY